VRETARAPGVAAVVVHLTLQSKCDETIEIGVDRPVTVNRDRGLRRIWLRSNRIAAGGRVATAATIRLPGPGTFRAEK
jgi:hypothetical protein